jgi:hypothetical protein
LGPPPPPPPPPPSCRRWAHASFKTWSLGHKIMEGFWARVRAGRAEDCTKGVRPMILYGDASFSATMRGTHSSPTTSMYRACVTVCGAAWVRQVDEHRTTKCCSACGCVLGRVLAVTPLRVFAAAAARAAAVLPGGWARPPPRPKPPWTKVRGLYRCPSAACSATSFRHRDGDAARLMLRNALYEEAHGEPLPFLKRERRNEETPRVFSLWPE